MILMTTLQAVPLASIDTKLSELKSIKVREGEVIVAFWNWILEPGIKLESADPTISELEKKRTLLQGLEGKLEISAEQIIDADFP